MARTPVRTRQRIATYLLLFCALACLAGGFYFRAYPPTQKGKDEKRGRALSAELRSRLEDVYLRLGSLNDEQAQTRTASAGACRELAFAGAMSVEHLEALLNCLQTYKGPYAFYPLNADAAYRARLRKAGARVGLRADPAVGDWESLSQAEKLLSLCTGTLAAEQQGGAAPDTLLYERGEPSFAVLQAAYACGLTEVVLPAATLDPTLWSDEGALTAFAAALPADAILCVPLSDDVPQAAWTQLLAALESGKTAAP